MTRRPLGATILAIWLFVASGLTFVGVAFAFTILQGYYDENLLNIAGISGSARFATNLPLGSAVIGLPALIGDAERPLDTPYVLLNVSLGAILGALYAIVGTFTLKGNKKAWFGNIAFSIVGIISVPILIAALYDSYIQYADPDFLGSFDQLFVQTLILYLVSLGIAAFRLYWLFRPSMRDYFGTRSLLKKQTV